MLARLTQLFIKPARGSRSQPFVIGASVGLFTAFVLLLLWASNAFAQMRLRLQDTHYVPLPTSETIVLIAIDDASLQAYGRAPVEWSRSLYADLVRIVAEGQPRVIAFDLLFTETTPEDDDFARAVRQARESEARVRTVVGAFGIQTTPSSIVPAQDFAFQRALPPTRSLMDVVDYLGYLNAYPDSDGILRRQPSLLTIDGEKQLSFSLATYLAYLRVPPAAASQVLNSSTGSLQVANERNLNVDASGLWLHYYFGESGSTFATYSMRDVLNGAVTSEVFEDKIVLVGVLNATGLEDNYLTPNQRSGKQMAGVEIYANAVESLLQDTALREQSESSQAVMILLLAICAAVVYAQLRWYWAIVSAIVLTGLWFVFAYSYFGLRLEMLNLFHSGLALLLPVPLLLGLDITSEVIRRQRSELLLGSLSTAARQRLAVDGIAAHLAADIQRLFPKTVGGVWLRRTGQSAFQPVVSWGSGDQRAESKALPLPQSISPQQLVTREQIQQPIMWQEKQVGFIRLVCPSKPPRSALRMLSQLCEQVAPLLENAMLYEEVQRQRSLVEAVLQGSPAGIFVLDDQGVIRRANRKAGEVFNFLPEEAVGKLFVDFTEKLHLAPELTIMKLHTALKNGQPAREEVRGLDKTFIVETARLSDEQTAIIIFSDVSALAELNETKTRMIRMASHDLKNPLGVIGTYLSLILDYTDPDSLTEQNRRYLENIARATDDMAALITDVLDLEHIGSDQRTLTRVDLNVQVRSVVEHHRLDLQLKALTLVLDLAANVQSVLGDNRGITQALSNLVGNAVKYTPEGGRITVRVWQADNYVKVEVEDTGYGIPVSAQREIFQPFFRVRTKTTQHIKGTGLGLSLVKAIIEANNGHVWFRSEEGIGSVFGFELPTAPLEEVFLEPAGDGS